MTTITQWFQHYLAHLSRLAPRERPRHKAKLHNLLSERRVEKATDDFVTHLTDTFDTLSAGGLDPAAAADASLETTIREFSVSGVLERQLPAASPGVQVAHFATARSIVQFGGLGDFDSDDPPRRIPVPSGMLYEGSNKRLLWITPDAVPNDADDAAQSLGLPHFAGHLVIEFILDGVGLAAYVPTCFDAGLYEAWMINLPAEQLVSGRTRHTESGHRVHREFVSALTDAQGRFQPGHTLPRGGAAIRVAAMNDDYMLGR